MLSFSSPALLCRHFPLDPYFPSARSGSARRRPHTFPTPDPSRCPWKSLSLPPPSLPCRAHRLFPQHRREPHKYKNRPSLQCHSHPLPQSAHSSWSSFLPPAALPFLHCCHTPRRSASYSATVNPVFRPRYLPPYSLPSRRPLPGPRKPLSIHLSPRPRYL